MVLQRPIGVARKTTKRVVHSQAGESATTAKRGFIEVIAAGQSFQIPASAWTLDGFRDWATSSDFPPKGRISYIAGDLIIDMSPEEYNNHNQVKTEVGYTTVGLHKELNLGKYFSDRMLLTNKEAEISTEPDAALATWETLAAGLLTFIPRRDTQGEFMELQGRPDWILEILSRFSIRKDTQVLRKCYHKAGVPEYWLINAMGKRIDFQILVSQPNDYALSQARQGWQYSPLFQRWFRLRRAKDRVGLWEYTLQVRSF